MAFFDYVLVVVVETGLAIALIPRYGVTGAAIAKTVGTALNNLLPLAQIWSMLKFHPYRLDFLKPVAAGLASIALAFLVVRAIDFEAGVTTAVTATAITAASYVGCMLLFGLNEQDRAVISSLFSRVKKRSGGGEGPR
jgi:O-antigen/teichoic acid export membrane protein